MKQINNHTANAIGKIHGTTFSVFLIANLIITALLDGELFPILQKVPNAWLVIISAIIDATLYAFIYAIVKKLFDIALIKSNKKMDVAGRWYHVHVPRFLGEIDYTAQRLSAGYTDISRELYDFTFDGHNQHFKLIEGVIMPLGDYTTHWFSKATKFADLNEFDLIEIYEAESKGKSIKTLDFCPCCKSKFDAPVPVSESENFRYGIHTYKFVGGINGECEKIEADFTDCWPSLKNGDLFFFRTEQERNKFMEQYFAIGRAKKAEAQLQANE